jgi:hypothetical protein
VPRPDIGVLSCGVSGFNATVKTNYLHRFRSQGYNHVTLRSHYISRSIGIENIWHRDGPYVYKL